MIEKKVGNSVESKQSSDYLQHLPIDSKLSAQMQIDNKLPIAPASPSDPISIHQKDLALRSPATVEIMPENKIIHEEGEFKLESVTFFKSLFNFCILALGTTTLALPGRIGGVSIVMFPVAVIIGGLCNLWSFILLAKLFKKFNVHSYEELIQKLFGKKLLICYVIFMDFYILSVILIYQVVIYKLIGGIINLLGEHKYSSANSFLKESYWKGYGYKFGVNFGITLLIFFPMCLMKNLNLFNYTSMFGIITLFLLELIILVQSPWYIKDYLKNVYKKDVPSTHYNVYDVGRGFKGDLRFLRILSTLFFCFSCHNGIFIVYDSLENNTLPRIKKLTYVSCIIDMASYIVFGIIGYLSDPSSELDLIIERRVIFNKDIIMLIGWFFLIIMAITKVPNNYFSLRFSILNLLGIKLEKISTKLNVLLALGILVFTTTLCSAYQSIIGYMDLIGSFFVVIIAFLFPAFLDIKSNGLPKLHWKNIVNGTIGILLTIFGFTSGVLTIIDMVNGN